MRSQGNSDDNGKPLKRLIVDCYSHYTMINHGDRSREIVQSPRFIVVTNKSKTDFQLLQQFKFYFCTL